MTVIYKKKARFRIVIYDLFVKKSKTITIFENGFKSLKEVTDKILKVLTTE